MRHSREKMQPLMALVPQSAIPIRKSVTPASRIVESATPQLIPNSLSRTSPKKQEMQRFLKEIGKEVGHA